jgi:starch phosphorylase
VPSLSVLDGWWIEGCVEGITGWAIGSDGPDARHPDGALSNGAAADSLYEKLGGAVVPCFYGDRQRFLGIMRNAIALNASFFNTQRMVLQYLYDAYLERPERSASRAIGSRWPTPLKRPT